MIVSNEIVTDEKITKLREFDNKKKQLTNGNFLHYDPFNYGNLARQTVEYRKFH